MLSGRSTEQLREAETAVRATGAQVSAHAGDVGSPDEASSIELVLEGDPAFAGAKRRDWSKSSAGSRNCEAGSIKPMKVP
jgi:hypothetical protein